MPSNKTLNKKQQNELIELIQNRFENNLVRHKDLKWEEIKTVLILPKNTEKLWTLSQMEKSGGEPNIVSFDHKSKECIFMDCSPESPKERRSLCYDREALMERKENKPRTSALEMATEIGIEILTEEQYRYLQTLGNFDAKTSSWIKTPENIRKLGGALFADLRYNHVFVYHNGAQSYYAARGFRGIVKI